METDGGGWTVFQRRQDGSIDFYRDWTDYENGFGNLTGEFWLGLSKIHRLTQKGSQALRVKLGDFSGNTAYAQYATFTIGDSTTDYMLSVKSYSGTAGDALIHDNIHPHHINDGMRFSTRDNDNDNYDTVNCAEVHKGAWWFNACYQSHLNAPYYHDSYSAATWRGIIWYDWKGKDYTLKFTEMKIRDNN